MTEAVKMSQLLDISRAEIAWVLFGFTAQSMYFMRFLVQWIASERVRQSIVPETFWYFSFTGGLMLLVYAQHRNDPVIMIGQFLGLFIYARNIYLIRLDKRPEKRIAALPAAEASASRAPSYRNLRGMFRFGLRSGAEQPMSLL